MHSLLRSTLCRNPRFVLATNWSIALVSNPVAGLLARLLACLLALMLTMQSDLAGVTSVAWLDCADRNHRQYPLNV